MDNLVVLDCEVYPNYFLVAFKNIDNHKVITIEAKGEDTTLTPEDHKLLHTVMAKRKTFGFNSRNYDLPIILYALTKKTCKQIHELSDSIIENNLQGWQSMKMHNLQIPRDYFHFDISEPSPGVRISLKLYGGRMHSHRLQDLPIEPGTNLTTEEMNSTLNYCINDLNTTIDLYNRVKDRIQLREDMSKDYGQQALSKSDAQIAELVIKTELSKLNPEKRLYAPRIPQGKTYRYKAPEFVNFHTDELNKALRTIEEHEFELDGRGSIKLPEKLAKMKIRIGQTDYQLGIGGLHSCESQQVVTATEDTLIIDKDVASYYPAIILNLGLYPLHLGQSFLEIYKDIVDKRLEAKATGDKVVNESLKIVINGSFGKLGSKWSALYSPDLMMQVTLTGQLSLLMLIEELQTWGLSVVSANTDGFVTMVNKDKLGEFQELCEAWESNTGFQLEETRYKALYSRDVNNYLAILEDMSHKGKGIFAQSGLMKNPQGEIIMDAVVDYLKYDTPLEHTIKTCDDVTKFLTVRTVAGGAVWRDDYLGKVVRWYYSTDGDSIHYKKNGNKVAKSDGAKPHMELGIFPKDIDYDVYVEEALGVLADLGIKTEGEKKCQTN